MLLDYWRAAGVTAAAAVVSGTIWSLTYPLWAVSIPVFVAKDTVLTLGIAAFFAWVYFKEVLPSMRHGFYLGLFMVVVPVLASITYIIAEAIGGLPVPPMYPEELPEWYLVFNSSLILLVLVGTTAVGSYLAKKQ